MGILIKKISQFMFLVLCVFSVTARSLESAPLPAKLNIAEAERLLFQNNLTVIAARHGVSAAQAARLIATYTPNPTLTVGGEQFKTDRRLHSLAADTGTASNPTYTFRIDQPLETANKKRLRTENAEYQLMANEAQVLDALRLQTLQMKQLFYGVVLARENLKSAKETLESIAKTEQLLEKQSKAGNIPEADLIKFQANRIQFERDVVTSQLSQDQGLRDLINILGGKSNAIGATSGMGSKGGTGAVVPPITPNVPNTLNAPSSNAARPEIELIGELVAPKIEIEQEELRRRSEDRPDVVAAKRLLDAAEKSICMARALRWSDVTVGGEYQRVGGDNTVGLVISVPLPLYNNHKGNIEQSEAQRNQLYAQYQQVKLQALTDVDKACQAWLSSRKMVELYTSSSLDKSRQSLEIVEKAYARNSVSLLDLLDAQRTYKQTLLAAHQAQFDALNALSQLESAVGSKKIEPVK